MSTLFVIYFSPTTRSFSISAAAARRRVKLSRQGDSILLVSLCSFLLLPAAHLVPPLLSCPAGLPRGRAHHLFDEMYDTHRAEKLLVPSGTDWISALPDGVPVHILGFLPADEAVRTCVLSRRWLHQWKFMRCLRVTSHRVWEKSADEINKFISSLLLLRDPGAALDEVELEFTYEPSGNDRASYPNIWIRHALLRQARALSVTLRGEYNLVFNVPPLVSRHLRKLC
nr:putative F-box/LRR-repeat protein At5g02700 [Lolium perenne]